MAAAVPSAAVFRTLRREILRDCAVTRVTFIKILPIGAMTILDFDRREEKYTLIAGSRLVFRLPRITP